MAFMGVKVRERKGAWWIVIDHRGMRNSKKIGPGAAGKKAAQEVAKKIQAHLALGESAFDSLTAGITLEAFAETFLHHIQHTRKPSTQEGYQQTLTHNIKPM